MTPEKMGMFMLEAESKGKVCMLPESIRLALSYMQRYDKLAAATRPLVREAGGHGQELRVIPLQAEALRPMPPLGGDGLCRMAI
jgi:hypothetical protein